jgi:hypothetical protein
MNQNQREVIVDVAWGVMIGAAFVVLIGLALYIECRERKAVRSRAIPNYPSLCLGYSSDGSMIFLTGDVTNGLASTAWTNRLESAVEAETKQKAE